MKLMYMTLGGTMMICAILIARLLLQNKVHRSVWLLLWALTALRLIVPLIPSSPLSVFNLPLFRQQAPAAAVPLQPSPAVQTAPPVAAVPQAAPTNPAVVLLIVWACVAAVIFLTFIIWHLRSLYRFRFAMKVELPFALPSNVRVRELEGLSGPLTYGVLRPVILLPLGMTKDPDTCRRVLAHELSHIRHGDVAGKWFYLLVTALHWFNPFVWLMLYTLTQDMEMRCDAEAIKTLGGERNAYAKMLVEAEEQKLRSYLTAGFSFSSTAQRLRAMLKGKSNKAVSICTAILLTVCLLAVFCTGQIIPSAKAVPAPEVPETETAKLPTEETETEIIETEASTEAPTEALTEETEEMTEETTEAPTEPETESEAITESASTESEPESAEAPESTEAPAKRTTDTGSITPLGSATLAYGEMRTAGIGTAWAELYSDNPSVVSVSGAYQGSSGYCCTLTGLRDGTANVYYRVGDTWNFFAAVTVLP